MFEGAFPELYQFQIDAHEALREGVHKRHRNQLVMAPTGSGKTIIGMNTIRQTLAMGRRAMFLADRRTLINQASEVADSLGLWNHGIIQAGNKRMDLSRAFQIASCQTLMRRGWPQNIDVLVIDEAHTLYKTWVDYITSPECKAIVVGLTATPFSPGLGKIFTNLINAASMAALTDQGILVPMRVFSCRRPDMAGAETSGGEWTDRAAEERELVIVGDVVTEWCRLAAGRKTLVFGATVKHCEELRKQFVEVGVQAELYTGHTTDEERVLLLERFKPHDAELRVLISVEALAKGFDVRDVECICDCRPLRKSLSTAIQMWGRGLRASKETGKTECFLLDFSGNIIRFADDFSDVYYNGLDHLDEGEKLDKEVRKDTEKEPKACPKCGYTPMGRKCIGCGYQPESRSLVEVLPGEMREVKLDNGKVLAQDEVHLWGQLATYAKEHNRNGKAQGQARAWFKEMTGKWPPHDFSIETTPHTPPTRNTVNKIKSLYIAYIRGRQAHGGAA